MGIFDILKGKVADLMGGDGSLMEKFGLLNQDKESNENINVDLDSLEKNPESDTEDIQNIKKQVGGNQITLDSLKKLVMDGSTPIGNTLKGIFSKFK